MFDFIDILATLIQWKVLCWVATLKSGSWSRKTDLREQFIDGFLKNQRRQWFRFSCDMRLERLFCVSIWKLYFQEYALEVLSESDWTQFISLSSIFVPRSLSIVPILEPFMPVSTSLCCEVLCCCLQILIWLWLRDSLKNRFDCKVREWQFH